MNFSVVPFVFVIGLASLVYAVSGRKWFTGPVRDLDSITVVEEQVVVQPNFSTIEIEAHSSQESFDFSKIEKGNQNL